MKRILVVTPRMPYPAPGADEQDRLQGSVLLKEMGYELSVIAKVAHYQKEEDRDALSRLLGSPVVTVPYSNRSLSLKRFLNPYWIDGASYEYTEPHIREVVEKEIQRFKPDVAWIDASFSWPLIQIFHRHGIKVVMRSLQIESTHILVDEGTTPINLFRWIGKELGERTMAIQADSVAAINANEEVLYQKMGARKVNTIPLRNLPSILEEPPIEYRDAWPLKILFSGSTFSVQHNRDGARKVFTEIAPELERRAPGAFTIHVTGGKLPQEILAMLPAHVIYEGFVTDYVAFAKTMDIAITPHLGTVGMHGKLFEPIARGIPTISVPYALAGFPFKGGEHLLFGETPKEVVEHLLALRDKQLREKIGTAGRALALKLFSRDQVKAHIHMALDI